MKVLVLLSTLGYFVTSTLTDIPNNTCRAWSCESGLGGSLLGTNRTCASQAGQKLLAESCQPDDYLCDVEQLISGSRNCTHTPVFPWKANMPAGDSCTSNGECFSSSCITISGKSTCAGRAQNVECNDDRQCNPGMFCYKNTVSLNTTCQPVRMINETCNGAWRCEFGSLCANNTCTRYGTLHEGRYFNITDDELYPSVEDIDQKMFRVCKSFWALPTAIKSEGGTKNLLECSPGPVKQFNSYERNDGNLTCEYIVTTANNRTEKYIKQAGCGFNIDDKYYCPKMRGGPEFDAQNLADQTTWSVAPSGCHHRSTIQYCRTVEDSPAQSVLLRQFMRYDWETTDENWSLIANHDKCVGNAITKTRAYWRIRDSALSVAMTYSCMVAGLILSLLF